MALKSDRSTLQTDISFFMNEAATRGGVATLSTAGSGASMDNGNAVAAYAADPSGKVALGLLVNDMVDIDLTRQHLNQHKDEVQKGGKVTLLTKGWVVTNSLQGSPAAGETAYLGHSGNIANPTFAATLAGGQMAKHVVGRFTSSVDQNGYAKVFIDLPNTTNS
jgi:hypothetical protein